MKAFCGWASPHLEGGERQPYLVVKNELRADPVCSYSGFTLTSCLSVGKVQNFWVLIPSLVERADDNSDYLLELIRGCTLV